MLITVVAAGAHARAWLIKPDGSGDAPTIQAGVDSAKAGDEVVLASGIFIGPGNREVDFGNKAITVTSLAGVHSSVVDCGGAGRGFVFNSGEGTTSVLEKITVRNGVANFQGGAIFCRSSSPTIRGNVFEDNFAAREGGAIYCDSSAALIQGNKFERNTSESGGGLWISGCSSVVVEDNEFVDNEAENGGGLACHSSFPEILCNQFTTNQAKFFGGGMDILDGSSPVIHDNDFVSNEAGEYGGGMRCEGSSPQIMENTFEANLAGVGGGGISCQNVSSPEIRNNTLDGNAAATGAGIFCADFSVPRITNNIISNSPVGNAIEAVSFSSPLIVCCDLFNNAGGNDLPLEHDDDSNNNIIQDPLFCGAAGSGYFYLQANSPCVDCNGSPIGRFGVDCPIVSVEVKSWGALKMLYQEGR